MAKIRTEHKEALLNMGKWADFVVYRDDLKLNGVPNAKANTQAVAHFLGPEAAKPVPRKAVKVEGAGSRAAKRINPNAGCILPPVQGDADSSLAAPPLEKSAGPAPPPPSPLPSSMQPVGGDALRVVAEISVEQLKALEGRSAGEIEIIRWVARSMGIAEAGGKVDISTCPDPAAWFYFSNCFRSPGFAQEFCRTMYSKIIPRGKDDGSKGDETFDGEVTVALLERLRRSRDGAVEAQRALAPKVTGPNPVPAATLGALA